MTCKDSVKWLENLKNDLGKSQFCELWNYEQALTETIELLKSNRFVELPCSVGDTFYAIVNEQVIAYNCVGFKYGHSAVTRKNNELLLLTVYDMEFVFGEEAFLSEEGAKAKLQEVNK